MQARKEIDLACVLVAKCLNLNWWSCGDSGGPP